MPARDQARRDAIVGRGDESSGSDGYVSPAAVAQARAVLSERMRSRMPEIEQAVLVRAAALLEKTEGLDPQFLDAQRAAVSAAVEYGLAAIEHGEERSLEVPALLHSHARLTARSGITLETMLRRYFGGYTLLSDFIVREAEECGLQRAVLQSVMRDTSTVFERLIATMTDEYMREVTVRLSSTEARASARVRALLAGELIDTGGFGYDFEAWHLGALVIGEGAAAAVRELAGALDRRLLVVRGDEAAVWAWFGGQRRVAAAEFDRILGFAWPGEISLAVGEAAHGLAGWRLTHQQARAVLPIVMRSPGAHVRYADVALRASMLQDDLLGASLRQLYLAPLESERDGGEALRETLRAYFAADRNASSAAAALGVSRRTVANRLRSIEALIDRPLNASCAEIEAALHLHDLQAIPLPAALETSPDPPESS